MSRRFRVKALRAFQSGIPWRQVFSLPDGTAAIKFWHLKVAEVFLRVMEGQVPFGGTLKV